MLKNTAVAKSGESMNDDAITTTTTTKKGNDASREAESTSAKKKPGWNALKDDFMMNSKLKVCFLVCFFDLVFLSYSVIHSVCSLFSIEILNLLMFITSYTHSFLDIYLYLSLSLSPNLSKHRIGIKIYPMKMMMKVTVTMKRKRKNLEREVVMMKKRMK
mmetsp:Transcript_34904/g.52708  ORF Transcript_34904/g.52708 Transcript_34904/m.52708 type:complete len:160 (+) Transcript_34904:203-682(+)